jgi:hypothetical protein
LLFTFIAIVVAASCVAASWRRLALASSITATDPALLLAALRKDGAAWTAVARELSATGEAEWEHELLEALEATPEDVRVALTNEQLGELDYRSQEWARVPRVCASIASSSGFLLASLAMRAGLAADAPDVNGAVASALNAATVGLAGAAFCIAAQSRARAVVRERMAAVDKLVERLEDRLRSPSKTV